MSTTNPLTISLLRILDQQKPSRPTQQSILQTPANTYSMIKQLFNSFKKDNQSRILQNKIYELKIHDTLPKSNQSKPIIPAKMDSLFQFHSINNVPDVINHLLILKSYLPSHLQIQMIMHITKQIIKINDLPTILSLFNKILKSKQCINDKLGLYKQIQKQMITKLLSFHMYFAERQIKQISNFLFGLPVHSTEILEFIANLFGKVKEIQDFESLKLIYTGIYQKIQQKQKQSFQNKPPPAYSFRPDERMQQSDEISQILQRTLMKITTNQHIKHIKQKTAHIQIKSIYKQKVFPKQQKFMIILYQESINKMLSFSSVSDPNSESSQQELKQKQKNIIDFIFIGLQNQGLIKSHRNDDNLVDFNVWKIFIGWYHLNCQVRTWMEYISIKMVNLVEKILQYPKAANKIIKLVLDYESNQNCISQFTIKPIQVTNLDQSVCQHFLRMLTIKNSNYTRYLSNKIQRKLIAFGMMIDQNQLYQPILMNPVTTQTIDIVLQTFQFEIVYQYYKKILGNSIRRGNFERYLTSVFENRPKKYKDFFIKVDSYNQGQIFQIQDHFLLKYFRKLNNSDMIVSYLRDMSNYLPSKYAIQLIHFFIKAFENRPEYKVIYGQAVRTLNIILSTRQAAQLTVEFKKHLKEIVEKKDIGNQVFKNVSQTMINDLKAFYSKQSR